MDQTENQGCDVDDLMCQMRVVSHLESIQGLVGTDRFKTEFPELDGLSEKISGKIEESEASIREAFNRCGLPLEDSPAPAPEPASQTEENLE